MCRIVPAGMGKETLGLLNLLCTERKGGKWDEHLGSTRAFDAKDPFLGLLFFAAADRCEGQEDADLRSPKDLGREFLLEPQGLLNGCEMIHEKFK